MGCCQTSLSLASQELLFSQMQTNQPRSRRDSYAEKSIDVSASNFQIPQENIGDLFQHKKEHYDPLQKQLPHILVSQHNIGNSLQNPSISNKQQNLLHISQGQQQPNSRITSYQSICLPEVFYFSSNILKNFDKNDFAVKQDFFVRNVIQDIKLYYEFGDLIGQGGFGKVYKAVHRATCT